jgi:cbb3-type cytochrome oxidase subunit 3
VCMQADTIFVLALIVLSIGAILWMRRQSSK